MLPKLEIDLPKSLSAIVEERIRDAIVNAELAFGQPLPEDGVGLSMGVSRTPMREALTRLQMQGLVVIVPKKGTFVFKPTLADAEQLASFRLVLEAEAVRRSLTFAPEATLESLRAAADNMRTARAAEDGKAYARADTRFHEAFFSNCNNVYLANAYHSISGRVAALRAHLSASQTSEQVTSFQEHLQIIESFEAGNVERIVATLSDHILRAATAYETALRRLGIDET
ncbi:DNA-binding transcriptional regulator, GntR family [Ensifer adhaerens]|nr:DNA-binding transcriptional regulator, GntR family [Ensifer adhaerens]HZG27424.1 GntR family transcriptional regulator [Ensifer sp.]